MLRWHSCLNGRERASLLDVSTSPGYGGGGSHVQRHVRRIGEETAPGAAFQPTGNQTNPEGICSGPADGGVAQLGEHLPCTQGVSGSNPLISTNASEQTTLCSEPPKRFARRGFDATLRCSSLSPQSLRFAGRYSGRAVWAHSSAG
jgi:hypothetical protein